jgi:endonuclease YncB( thermonuclease family)
MRDVAPTKTYTVLRSKVQDTFTTALKRIESERVRTYWKTGRLIAKHILQSKGRTGYGDRVVERLAEDLSIEKSVLNRTIQFYRQFPKLVDANIASGQHLSWSQYRTLLPVSDTKKRLELARRAQTQGWTGPELLEEVRKVKSRLVAVPKKSVQLTPVPLGLFYHYRIVEEVSITSAKPTRFVDLGFDVRIGIERFDLGNIKAGEIVRSTQDSDGTFHLKKVTKVFTRDTFTYYASVIRVIDGDTLWMHIQLGFGILKKVKIRLTNIDTVPLTEPRGRKAKAFVESTLKSASQIIIRSRYAGKFSRYLGDIFTVSSDGKGEPSHLNQMLLDQGLATANTTSH